MLVFFTSSTKVWKYTWTLLKHTFRLPRLMSQSILTAYILQATPGHQSKQVARGAGIWLHKVAQGGGRDFPRILKWSSRNSVVQILDLARCPDKYEIGYHTSIEWCSITRGKAWKEWSSVINFSYHGLFNYFNDRLGLLISVCWIYLPWPCILRAKWRPCQQL